MQYSFIELHTAKQHKHETPKEFVDQCHALIAKEDDTPLYKFHYDYAQKTQLSTFIVDLPRSPGQQV
jgi:hypothetical protein